MAINVYSGVMGSGKSYEVMVSVVLPAIKAGRRVVTNIDGISEEKIHAYLEKEGVDPGSFGSVVHVADKRIEEPQFFPSEHCPDAVVQGGDLLVVDEAWRFWAAGKALSDEHMSFFRMHRHFVHPETKVSCDLALVFQSVTDISRALRAVVELHFNMRKLKSLGLARSYTVTWYEGGKQTKAASVGQRVQRYDKSIFPLYQSYVGGAGNESVIDSRQNVLFTKKMLFFVVVLLLLVGFGVPSGFKFFNPNNAEEQTISAQLATESSLSVAGSVGSDVGLSSGDYITPSADVPLGVIVVRGVRRVVYLEDGRIKFNDYDGCSGRGISLECVPR